MPVHVLVGSSVGSSGLVREGSKCSLPPSSLPLLCYLLQGLIPFLWWPPHFPPSLPYRNEIAKAGQVKLTDLIS